ncbi:hypothetical protein Tco_1428100 [Tanacetum coccineum]
MRKKTLDKTHKYGLGTCVAPLWRCVHFNRMTEEKIKNIRYVRLRGLETTKERKECLKEEMLRNCHGHNLSKGNIIKIFYHGLNEITIEVLNAAAGGVFLYKTPNQAYQLLKDKVLLKLDKAKNQKTKSSLKKTVAFAAEGSSNSNTNKNMARMDTITMKMDTQYKDFQSRSKQSNLDDDDIFVIFTMITVTVIPTAITGVQVEETITTEITINLTLMINPIIKNN